MHYILQDRHTGYIWGDTRDVDGVAVECADPVEACRVIDESLGAVGRRYTEVSRLSSDKGYIVYEALGNGSELIPVIWDGQAKDTIEAVEQLPVAAYVEYVEGDE